MKKEVKFCAEIVFARSGQRVWMSQRKYGNVEECVSAIVTRAKRFKHRVTDYTRHWNSEGMQMVDYGSYSFYGRISKWRKHENKWIRIDER